LRSRGWLEADDREKCPMPCVLLSAWLETRPEPDAHVLALGRLPILGRLMRCCGIQTPTQSVRLSRMPPSAQRFSTRVRSSKLSVHGLVLHIPVRSGVRMDRDCESYAHALDEAAGGRSTDGSNPTRS